MRKLVKTAKSAARKKRTSKASEGEFVTRAVAAQALGVSPNRINKWVAQGAPVAVPGRAFHAAKYDVQKLQEWREAQGPEQDESISLGRSRARLAEAQAIRVERENMVASGLLLDRDEVIAKGIGHITAAKAQLLQLPRLMVMRGLIPKEREPAVRALVVEALRALAQWHPTDIADKATA